MTRQQRAELAVLAENFARISRDLLAVASRTAEQMREGNDAIERINAKVRRRIAELERYRKTKSG